MKYCPKCGKELTDDSSFCTACGVPVRKSERETDSSRIEKRKLILRYSAVLALATGVFWICYIILNTLSDMVIYPCGISHLIAFSIIKPIIFKLLLILSLSGFFAACFILVFKKNRIWLTCVLVLLAIGSIGAAYILMFNYAITSMLDVSDVHFTYVLHQLRNAGIMCGISIPTFLGGLYLCAKKTQLSIVFRNMAILAGLFIIVSVPSAVLAVYNLGMGTQGAFLFVALSGGICFIVSLVLNKERQRKIS